MSGAMRVTDLDKFALEEIWRPYQSMKGYEKRLECSPMSLTDTATELATDTTGWARCVFNRLRGIGVRFPAYIRHSLVDVVEAAISRAKPADSDSSRDAKQPSPPQPSLAGPPEPEPVAWLKEWTDCGHARKRADLTPGCEPWLAYIGPRVTPLVRRAVPAPKPEPVMWQVRDYADGWITFYSEERAKQEVEEMGGALMRPLYASPVPAPKPTEEEVARVIAMDQTYRAEVRDEQQTWLASHIAGRIFPLFRSRRDGR